MKIAAAILAAALTSAFPATAQTQYPYQSTAYRGSVLHFTADPATSEHPYEYYEDGVLLVGADGKVKAVGPASQVLGNYQQVNVVDYSGKLIMPGFIDSHVHYPQTEMIGSSASSCCNGWRPTPFPPSGSSPTRLTRKAWPRCS